MPFLQALIRRIIEEDSPDLLDDALTTDGKKAKKKTVEGLSVSDYVKQFEVRGELVPQELVPAIDDPPADWMLPRRM